MRQPIPVTIAVAARRDVPIYLAGLGTVQASNTTAIHTQIDGKLQSVNFTEGQVVHKGDALVQIDPRLYQAALDQAKAKKAADAAQLISAEKDLDRFKTLAAKDNATQQSVDQQQAKVDQLKATIDADQAAIESAQTQLDYTTIAAPTDGRVGIRQVDPGNIVHVADTTPIVVLTQTRPIAIVFTLPEIDLPDVRRAMARGPVAVLAYDQNDARLLGSGTAAAGRQRDRSNHEHDQAEGDVSQRRRDAVAGRVRPCAASGRHPQGCGHGSLGRRAARSAWALCLGRAGRGYG